MFEYCKNLTSFEANLSSLTNANNMFYGCDKLTRFTGDLSKLSDGRGMFYNAAITNFASDLPKLKYGHGMFSGCKLNKESALRVLASLPSASGPFYIGIHIDHKADEEVIAAIADAEAKGWTLTVQWNGTATASAAATYGLRGPLVYARVVEENGERMLDWGHYVTDETGYETFRSIEAAREYFGIEEE